MFNESWIVSFSRFVCAGLEISIRMYHLVHIGQGSLGWDKGVIRRCDFFNSQNIFCCFFARYRWEITDPPVTSLHFFALVKKLIHADVFSTLFFQASKGCFMSHFPPTSLTQAAISGHRAM